MIFLIKKFIAILIIGLLIFPAELNQTEAASDTLSKTAEFFIGQDGAVNGSGVLVSLPSFTINIPEGSPVVKSAIIEINGVTYNDSGVGQTIMADLQRGAASAGAESSYVFNYTLAGINGKPKPLTLKYNALENNAGIAGLGAMSNINAVNTDYTYRLYLKNTVASGTANFSLASAKLVLTYNSSASGANFLKTNKFFISQEKNPTPGNSEISRNFSLTISEKNPEMKSVFVEVSGIAKGSGANTVQLSAVKQGFPVYNAYSIDLGPAAANSKFIARYDMSGLIGANDFPGTDNYILYVKNSFDAYLLSAKAIVTYKYSENVGGLPPSGYVISSTIDTGIAKGAAYNSLMWKGSLNSGEVGQVGLQIAASDSINGSWLFEGPDCTSNSKYAADANTPIPIEIVCAANHNNKRYFRYKVIICSSANCADSGSVNPEVDGVVVNWGP